MKGYTEGGGGSGTHGARSVCGTAPTPLQTERGQVMMPAQRTAPHPPANHRGSKLVNSPPNTPTLAGTFTDFSFAFTISTVRPVFKNRAMNSLTAMARWWAVKVSCRSKPVTAFRMT